MKNVGLQNYVQNNFRTICARKQQFSDNLTALKTIFGQFERANADLRFICGLAGE
jgi:hypothetical protein